MNKNIEPGQWVLFREHSLVPIPAIRLQENRSNPDDYIFKGIFAELGVENNNKRIYEEKEYLAHLTSLKERAQRKELLGEMDHPETYDVNLKYLSHIVTDVRYNKQQATIDGTIRLINGSHFGEQAKALFNEGIQLYISSRAAGTVREDKRVTIQQIFAYDLVACPGFSKAKMNRVVEGRNNDHHILLQESVNLSNYFEVDDNRYKIYKMDEPVVNSLMESGLLPRQRQSTSKTFYGMGYNNSTSGINKETNSMNNISNYDTPIRQLEEAFNSRVTAENQQFQKYDTKIAELESKLERYAELSERRIRLLDEKFDSKINTTAAWGDGLVTEINETINGLVKYTEHIAFESKKIDERVRLTNKYMDYVRSTINEKFSLYESEFKNNRGAIKALKEYTEQVIHPQLEGLSNYCDSVLRENIENLGTYTDTVIREDLQKLFDYTDSIIRENLQHVADYVDGPLRERVEKIGGYVDGPLRERVEKIGGYVDGPVRERLEKIGSYVDGPLRERVEGISGYLEEVVHENLQNNIEYSKYIAESINRSNGYVKKDNVLNEKINKDDIYNVINSVKKKRTESQELVMEGVYPFIKLVSTEDREPFYQLDGNQQKEVAARVKRNGLYESAQILKVISEVKAGHGEIPNWIAKMPAKYRPIWESMSNEQREQIIAQAQCYILETDYQINNFWMQRTSNRISLNTIERIDEKREIEEAYKPMFNLGYSLDDIQQLMKK